MEIIQKIYKHHFARYVVVGGTTFIIDISILIFLHGHVHINLAVATTIAYWTSIIYNFCLNRWWSFSASEKDSLHKHLIPYAVLLGFNYLFTVIFVGLVSHVMYYGLAKVLAVAISMSWTYFIYRDVIFIKKKPLADS
ncbi:MAG TPA: GtrA family protein [Candidatus Saccharimonadales bacterium]|nr:GtrA family protein [Candidatus Saccharimonadales bacterium]